MFAGTVVCLGVHVFLLKCKIQLVLALTSIEKIPTLSMAFGLSKFEGISLSFFYF
jgi:hypothetical protein